MKYFYGEFDGEEFPTQDKLFGFDQLMQFILQYGDQALKAIEQMLKDPKVVERLRALGYAPSYLGGAEFREFVVKDLEQWKGVSRNANITLE